MDEDLSIINANTRNEKIKNFFINNKSKLITGIIILIILLIAVFSYDKYLINKKKEISDKFNSITIDYSEKTKDQTSRGLIEIINKKDPTYSPLSLYFIVDNNLVTDQSKINSLFDLLIKETSLDSEIKNLIIYKKALYNSEFVSENILITQLKPLINSKSIWKSHALHLLGEYFYYKKEKKKSKEFFEQIVNLENANLEIKNEAKKRILRDFSE